MDKVTMILSLVSLVISVSTPIYLFFKSRVNLLVENIGTDKIDNSDFYILIRITNKSSKSIAVSNIDIIQNSKKYIPYRKPHALISPLWDWDLSHELYFKQVPETMTSRFPNNILSNETKEFLIEFTNVKDFNYNDEFELIITTPRKIISYKTKHKGLTKMQLERLI